MQQLLALACCSDDLTALTWCAASNGNVSAGPPAAPRDPLEELYGSPEPKAQPSMHLCPCFLISAALPLPPTPVLPMQQWYTVDSSRTQAYPFS